MNGKAFLLASVFILAGSYVSFADDVVSLEHESLKGEYLGGAVRYLEEKEYKYKPADVLGGKADRLFVRNKNEIVSFGYTRSTYWIQFTVSNPAQAGREWYLEFEEPVVNSVSLYIPRRDGTFSVKESGCDVPVKERDFKTRTFIFRLNTEPGNVTYYMHVASRGATVIPLRAWSYRSLVDKISTRDVMIMLFYGFMIIMMIYNLLIFISMKNITYLYYVFHILSVSYMIMILDGTGTQFFWSEYPWINRTDIAVPLSIVTGFLFARSFLETRINSRYMDKVLVAYMGLSLLPLVSAFFIPFFYNNLITSNLIVIAELIGIAIGIIYVVRGIRMAYFYLPAYGTAMILGAVGSLRYYGLVPSNQFSINAVYFGFTLMIILFSFGLADKINSMRKELVLLNTDLEGQVRDRTEDLNAAMEELEAVNSSLVSTNRELEDYHRWSELNMKMAANVQRALYPSEPPAAAGWDIAFTFRPMSGVSGDFYDFYTEGGSLRGVALFDVSGHGVASGLITMIARSVFMKSFLAMKDERLNTVMQTANNELIAELEGVDNYLTGILLRMDGDGIEYVNAGHPDILYRSAIRDRVVPVKPKDEDYRGMFLGVRAMENRFKVMNFKIAPGDSIVLFTDCCVECRDAGGSEYGIDRLADSFRGAPDGSAREVLEHLLQGFVTHTGEGCFQDDLTVLVLKRTA